MSTLILLHGAWHTGSCWHKVTSVLQNSEHTVITPTLPGNDGNASAQLAYKDYVQRVVDTVEAQEGPVTLVGHSSAGHLIQMAAPCVAERIERIIFNNAWILPHNVAQMDIAPQEVAKEMIAAARASSDCCIPVNPSFVETALANEASPQVYAELLQHLVPQPLSFLTTPIDAESFAKLSIPMALLYCTKDQSLPQHAFLAMFQALGENPVVEIPCDHEGFFTNPEVFATGLLQSLDCA